MALPENATQDSRYFQTADDYVLHLVKREDRVLAATLRTPDEISASTVNGLEGRDASSLPVAGQNDASALYERLRRTTFRQKAGSAPVALTAHSVCTSCEKGRIHHHCASGQGGYLEQETYCVAEARADHYYLHREVGHFTVPVIGQDDEGLPNRVRCQRPAWFLAGGIATHLDSTGRRAMLPSIGGGPNGSVGQAELGYFQDSAIH